MYPKKITIQNDKLKKLLIEKSELITLGRETSEEIEKIEQEMNELDEQMKLVQKSVDISDLQEKAKVIGEKMEVCIQEMKEVEKEIDTRLKEKSPTELLDRYDTLKNEKEKKETERNKLAIKAQKYNHKIIPLGRKVMFPYLEDMYDDYETLKIEGGDIVATIFNHLNDFKINFKKKQ